MNRKLSVYAIFILILAALILVACEPFSAISSQSDAEMLLTPMPTNAFCADCDQATLAAAQTQQKNSSDAQVAATAEIARANAQATLNSANATLSAAQAQQQNNANIIAAQIAATAEIAQANAQATLNSAGATQSAALAQDAARQTQAQFNLALTMEQQNKNEIAAGTQTVIANVIATQTQSAAATSQWYADQDRQREEQRQGPIAFLWMWCLPLFVVLFAGLLLWGFWSWLKIQQANQRIVENPVNKDDAQPYLESDVVESRYQLVEPDDQVHQWLDEVKDQLLSDDKKDEENDHPDH